MYLQIFMISGTHKLHKATMRLCLFYNFMLTLVRQMALQSYVLSLYYSNFAYRYSLVLIFLL